MSLMQTIQEIVALQREIQQQLQLIESFQRSNRDQMATVRTELQGSTKAYDQLMLQALDRAEDALRKSSAALQQASAALVRVQTI